MIKGVVSRIAAAIAVAGLTYSGAYAGSIILTGHDVTLHAGQNSWDAVALDFLRGEGTASEIAKGSYDIAVVGSGAGFATFTGGALFTTATDPGPDGNPIPLSGSTLTGYGSATYYHATTADWDDVLSKDLLYILSHTSCGGCDVTDADVDAINAQSAAITTAFNAGMDIWGESGASSTEYYDFLPPGAVATGLPIGGSSGFECTPEGAALGFIGGTGCVGSPSMINGFPTHNRFVGFDSDFVVFEIRPQTGVDEVITIGIRDARIGTDDIGTDDTGDDGTDGGDGIPEPATLSLLGLAALGLAFSRRRRQKR